jgi:hypothetical protein
MQEMQMDRWASWQHCGMLFSAYCETRPCFTSPAEQRGDPSSLRRGSPSFRRFAADPHVAPLGFSLAGLKIPSRISGWRLGARSSGRILSTSLLRPGPCQRSSVSGRTTKASPVVSGRGRAGRGEEVTV